MIKIRYLLGKQQYIAGYSITFDGPTAYLTVPGGCIQTLIPSNIAAILPIAVGQRIQLLPDVPEFSQGMQFGEILAVDRSPYASLHICVYFPGPDMQRWFPVTDLDFTPLD